METGYDLITGFRVPGPVTNIAAAGTANAAVVFAAGGGAFLGTRSYKLKKLAIRDRGTGGTFVHIGTGVAGAFADLIPAIKTVNNFDIEVDQNTLNSAEAFASITAYPEAVGGSSVDVQVEVEEIGG